MFESLGIALASFFTFEVMLACVIGGLIGFTVGAIPGIGSVEGIVLVMPISMLFTPEVALTLFMAIYMGAEFGGCVSSILMNVPGTSSAAATALDGFPMSKQGRAITALSISSTASFFGGSITPILCIVMIPVLARIVLLFGTPEFFLLGVLGIVCIAAVDKESLLKGLFAGSIGLMLCTVGISTLDVQQRYTFGLINLHEGFGFLPPLIGLFGIAEMLKLAKAKESGIAETVELKGSRLEGILLVFKNWRTLIRSTLIGFFVGLVPGVGATTSTFIAWAQAKRASKTPDEFGKGCPEGIVATESANNSVVPGALMPTLLFGIPGSGSAAVVLGGLLMHGLQPGRALFRGDGLVLTEILLISLVACSFFCFFLGLFIAPYFSRITLVRKEILIPTIFVLASLGVYISAHNLFSVFLILVFGLVGFFMIIADIPLFPLVLGLILGDMVETNLLRSLQLGKGSLMFFFARPVCIILMVVIAILVFTPLFKSLCRKIFPPKAAR